MQQTKNSTKLGLALSGGGYRASAFHLGTLNKLHQMGLLSEVDVMSTISGGSITGAAFCLREGDYPAFHQKMVEAFKTNNVIKYALMSLTGLKALLVLVCLLLVPVGLLFTSYPYMSAVVFVAVFYLLLKYQFNIFPISKEIEKAYDHFFYQQKTLGDLCDKPLLAIGSSNLESGRPFTFSKKKMSDSSFGALKPPILLKQKDFPVARAVMASSCVPFAFTPVSIAKHFFANEADTQRVAPTLVDGGVYDNQGIEKITQQRSMYECGIIITSDAGGGYTSPAKYKNVLSLGMQVVDMFMYRIKNFQIMENIYRNVKAGQKPIAYLSLGWRVEKCIPGFIDNMAKDLVLPQVIAAHSFEAIWISDPNKYRTAIENHLQLKTGYATIKANDLTAEQWQIARQAPTNLTPLTTDQVNYLIRQAENLTELQVKLYCPQLLNL